MKRNTGFAALAAIAGLLLAAAPAGADIIYSESFGGSDTNALSGTSPDIRPGAETWMAVNWSETGKLNVFADSNAFLPFTPEAGKLYTLTATLDPKTAGIGTSHWLALGFAQSNNTGVDFWASPNNSGPWVLFRQEDAAATVIGTYTGPGTTGSQAHDLNPDKVGAVVFTIELDTTAANWTADWYEDGNLLRSHTFITNPTIHYVGFGGVEATGIIDDFSLVVIPEPSTLALVGLCGLTLLCVRGSFRK